MCEQAEPEEQQTTDQEQDSQLNDDPTCIMRQEEEEETTEQRAETDAHESPQSMLEGLLKYEPVASFAGSALLVQGASLRCPPSIRAG